MQGGCLSYSVQRVSGELGSASIAMVNESPNVSISIGDMPIVASVTALPHIAPIVGSISPHMEAYVSLVCDVDVAEHEVFYVKEGVFLLVDGKKLKVLKYEGLSE